MKFLVDEKKHTHYIEILLSNVITTQIMDGSVTIFSRFSLVRGKALVCVCHANALNEHPLCADFCTVAGGTAHNSHTVPDSAD